MKTIFHTAVFVALASGAVDLMAGCAGNGNLAKTAGAPAAPAAPGSPAIPGSGSGPGTKASGTSDTGGGHILNGKVFEAYIRDPLKRPAYSGYLRRLLDNIRNEKNEKAQLFEPLFKLKTWYFAPVDLDSVGKEVLAISFMRNRPEQIGAQTMREVWIDDRLYAPQPPSAPASLEDQGDLLLHEIVETAYLLKFMSAADFCKASASYFDGNAKRLSFGDCGEFAKQMDRARPPEAPRALVDGDYLNIRNVVGFIEMNAEQPIAEARLVDVLLANGFDPRFFQERGNIAPKSRPNKLKMSEARLFEALHGAEISRNMPSLCSSEQEPLAASCEIKIEPATEKFLGTELKTFRMTVSRAGEPSVQLVTTGLGDDFELTGTEKPDGTASYTLAFVEFREKIQVGDRVNSGFFIFHAEKSRMAVASSWPDLVLDAVGIRPGMVIAIDKTQSPACQLRAPKVDRFFDGAVVVERPGLSGEDRLLAASASQQLPPMAACLIPGNVD